MARILITGSRDWTDVAVVERVLRDFVNVFPRPVLVQGGAAGADSIARGLWRSWGGGTDTYRADWTRYGKRAGYIRNQEMVDAGADVCLAFIKNDSRGASMCAALAEKAGIPVVYYRED